MPDRISDDILHSIPTRMFLFVIPKYFFRFLRSRPRWDRRFSMAEEQMLQAKSEASSLRTQLQAVGPGPPRVVLDGETNGGSPILRSWDSETRWWWDHYEMIMRWLRWRITVWFLFLPRWDDYDDSCCASQFPMFLSICPLSFSLRTSPLLVKKSPVLYLIGSEWICIIPQKRPRTLQPKTFT